MSERPADRGTVTAVAVLAVAAVVLCVAVHGLWSTVAPYIGFVDHATATGVVTAFAVLAVCATWAGKTLVPILALSAAFAQSAEPLAASIATQTGLWVAVAACGVIVAVATAWLAVTTPGGAIRDPLERCVAALAIVVGAAAFTIGSLVYDPAEWGWCECAVADDPFLIDPNSYLALWRGLSAAWGAVGILVVVSTARRAARPYASRADLAVVIGAALVGGSWVVQGVVAVATVAGQASALWLVHMGATIFLLIALTVRVLTRRARRARLADLLTGMSVGTPLAEVEQRLQRALGDRSLRVILVDADWPDAPHLVDPPIPPSTRAVVPIGDGVAPVVIVDLAVDPESDPLLHSTIARALALWAENIKLESELRESLAQVQRSRARIVAASDEARRRVERDLHDGAQQLLVAAGVSLAEASAKVAHDHAVAALLDQAATRLERALGELRDLASGIAPPALTHGSLGDALRELALRCPVPTTVSVIGGGEPDARVREAAYFVVAESLANVAKHSGARTAAVELDLGPPTRVTVRDDGVGGAAIAAGSGLRGLVDRVEALGGTFSVSSVPGDTTVRALLTGAGS